MFKNQEWLDNLQEGDKVIVSSRWGYKLDKITKITPTRIIRTEGGYSFNKDGRERGYSWNSSSLSPVTDEILEKIERTKLINIINKTDFSELPLSTLNDIHLLINRS